MYAGARVAKWITHSTSNGGIASSSLAVGVKFLVPNLAVGVKFSGATEWSNHHQGCHSVQGSHIR